MNTIKRDVYVLKNTIKIPIEVTKGTDAITFEFTSHGIITFQLQLQQ